MGTKMVETLVAAWALSWDSLTDFLEVEKLDT